MIYAMIGCMFIGFILGRIYEAWIESKIYK